MYTILQQTGQALKKDMVSFARELIETPSVSFEESEIAPKVERMMKELDYDKVFCDDFGNLVGVIFGIEREPAVLLNSHMDTVEADSGKWQADPFKSSISDGKLYGLGAADCKGGLAAQVFAGGMLKRSLLPLKGNLVVAATVAEHNGISLGVRGLIEQTLPEIGLNPTHAILGEPTGCGLYYGHDGWLEMDIDIEGVNPFHVTDAAKSICEFVGSDSRKNGSDSQAEEVALQGPRFENRNGFRHSNIRLARRLRQSEEADMVLSRMGREVGLVASSNGGVAVKVALRKENRNLYNGRACQVHSVVNAWSTDPFHPLVEKSLRALRAAGCSAEPGKWELARLCMGTSGNALAGRFNIPTVGYGPGEEKLAHAVDEYVDLDKLAETSYGTAAIVHSLTGVPVFGWTSDDI